MEFLAENNSCGQTILRLVSRGNAIVAELLRLSDHIPSVFYMDKPTDKPYQMILFDFKYFKTTDLCENRIENSAELQDLDQEFRDDHLEILQRFYQVFESIYKYIDDLLTYHKEVEEGVFIQQTLEGILLSNDGKQLMAEAVYLYGVMLTLLDARIPGIVRERMLISYLRYAGQTEVPLIDKVCQLCRSTLTGKDNQREKGYPESYFARVPIPETLVQMIVARLRSDDIYNQIKAYPLPDHRSAALATQAQMLYIILYFAPSILKDSSAVMREIVDKHFPDNWVIAFYLGFIVDLSVAWEPYRAAKAALANTMQPANVQALQRRYLSKSADVRAELANYLTEGVLTEELVLDSHGKLLNCMRDCNVTLRWLMLHTNAANKKVRELVVPGVERSMMLQLLLDTAQFEYLLKCLVERMLREKEAKWNTDKLEASERMKEMGEYFSGTKAITRVKKNDQLMAWFENISVQIAALDYTDSTIAGRKIQQLMLALEEVEQFHQIETSVQVRSFLQETRAILRNMIRLVNIKEEIMVTQSLISDVAYAWEIITHYIGLMQENIKRDPKSVMKLRATFLKLSSILDLPLIRIGQCQSPDIMSVSEYYSGELVRFVRRVLAIVPQSMFVILREIVNLTTSKISELPTKVEKERLKDAAQLDERFLLARATHAVSVFTEGILAMDTTLVGIIKVDPKLLLEDGIRKELVMQIAQAMDSTLIFKLNKIEDFEKRLVQLSATLDGFRRSFQYIQDYVNIQGLRIWQEEFSRIVHYSIEQECNSFLKSKIFDHESYYQSESIPIPRFPPADDKSVNFIGRLARAFIEHTNWRTTIFLDLMGAWYDRSGRELIGIKSFSLLMRGVGVFGVTGLDKLLCFMIVKVLQTFVAKLRTALADKQLRAVLASFAQEILPPDTIPTNAQKLYAVMAEKCKPMWPIFIEAVCTVGQLQLLRRQLSNHLNFICKLDSNNLACALEVMNRAVIADVQQHYLQPDEKPYPKEDSQLLFELTAYLETAGISAPLSKIYITTTPIDHFPCLMFLLVIAQLDKFTYNSQLGILWARKDKSAFDSTPFIIGIISLLKQFHSSTQEQFFAFLGQYVRGLVNLSQRDAKPSTDYPVGVHNVLVFLEQYCKHSSTPRKVVEGYVPAYLFANFKKAS